MSRRRVVKTPDGVAHLKVRLASFTLCNRGEPQVELRPAKRRVKPDCEACISYARSLDEGD